MGELANLGPLDEYKTRRDAGYYSSSRMRVITDNEYAEQLIVKAVLLGCTQHSTGNDGDCYDCIDYIPNKGNGQHRYRIFLKVKRKNGRWKVVIDMYNKFFN